MKKHSVLISRASLLLVLCLFASGLFSQNKFVGVWKTIDDETQKPKSLVEIYEEGGKLHGKIIKLFREPSEEQDPVCDNCDEDDPRYMEKVIGMVILQNLKKDSDTEWENGKILDPKNGKVYDCDISLEEADKLKVRGYIGFSLLGRTQYWMREK
jgi:uncharacterized protein (DUF2147 family)